jgi:hypothetical protein
MWKVLVAVGAVLVTGCSSGSGAGNGGGSSSGGGSTGACSPVSPNACFGSCNPCTHTGLTEAQVQAVVGAPVVEEDTSQNGGRNCAFSQNDQYGFPIVLVGFDSDIDDATFKSVCNGTPLAGETITPVTGVGDLACSIKVGSGSPPILHFEKGCWGYMVEVQGSMTHPYTDATIEADEKTLALEILPKL